MPIYEYRCQKCGEKFELLQGINETPVCNSCGSKELTRLFSPAAVMGGSNQTETSGSCCGLTNSCRAPKRCCGA
ncbi:MAG: zinc ribbon domain-containing protein [bacterium]